MNVMDAATEQGNRYGYVTKRGTLANASGHFFAGDSTVDDVNIRLYALDATELLTCPAQNRPRHTSETPTEAIVTGVGYLSGLVCKGAVKIMIYPRIAYARPSLL